MLKHTWFKNQLGKVETDVQRLLISKTFNALWEQYDKEVEAVRQLWQTRKIGITQYREATKSEFKTLRQELRARLEVVL